jgi:hypothetical protein
MIDLEFRSHVRMHKTRCLNRFDGGELAHSICVPEAAAHLSGQPNILRIANRRVVRQGF